MTFSMPISPISRSRSTTAPAGSNPGIAVDESLGERCSMGGVCSGVVLHVVGSVQIAKQPLALRRLGSGRRAAHDGEPRERRESAGHELASHRNVGVGHDAHVGPETDSVGIEPRHAPRILRHADGPAQTLRVGADSEQHPIRDQRRHSNHLGAGPHDFDGDLRYVTEPREATAARRAPVASLRDVVDNAAAVNAK